MQICKRISILNVCRFCKPPVVALCENPKEGVGVFFFVQFIGDRHAYVLKTVYTSVQALRVRVRSVNLEEKMIFCYC